MPRVLKRLMIWALDVEPEPLFLSNLDCPSEVRFLTGLHHNHMTGYLSGFGNVTLSPVAPGHRVRIVNGSQQCLPLAVVLFAHLSRRTEVH